MRKGRWLRRRREPLKGVAAGAIGGLVASWVMEQAMKATQALEKSWKKAKVDDASQQGSDQAEESEDATQKAADKLTQTVLHRPLSKEQKKVAGPVVHYAFGTAMGAVYGAAAERLPVTSAVGVPFGAAVWLGADEIGVPAAGLSKPPREYPLEVHLNALAGHIAYGVTTELVRRGVRALL